eukprot:TRINITY_DN7344_c0_g1_i1.p1 TRINITY_DN7344_c0_g1~~TRINITY_DN7344_c0_g1_i1.p1  ORF type:complete len:514 (-),score=126.85 TRINITY_DN7344_c0_g1_i1:121-1662(-)
MMRRSLGVVTRSGGRWRRCSKIRYYSTGIVSDDHHAVVSTFDLFSIGVGPSSSHTVGPMRAARKFAALLHDSGEDQRTTKVTCELFGSLACTGEGHSTPQAILMGFEGQSPESIDPDLIPRRFEEIKSSHQLNLYGTKPISFHYSKDLIWSKTKLLPLHSNGMRFMALDQNSDLIRTEIYYSIGGGFVISSQAPLDNAFVKVHESESESKSEDESRLDLSNQPVYPFKTAEDLLTYCRNLNLSISQVVIANELTWRSSSQIHDGLLKIWDTMNSSIQRGMLSSQTHLPGKIRARRRAPSLYSLLTSNKPPASSPLRNDGTSKKLDWLSCFAIAVNEENAAGGRVVTAPTNGAAGIIPAVLKYYTKFVEPKTEEETVQGVIEFLTTASGIGQLIKRGASISAAEVGCQGEVGVACSMAAAGLAAVLGGNVEQVENAAEIGLEHNLGLTCDPIEGLVQIPCIERNAMGAAKAVAAARLALSGDGKHVVSLDNVIATMRATGHDMMAKYKETSEGG